MYPIQYNAPWHKLTDVCVGATYDCDFYSPIKNSKIRDSLQKISQETEEDYQNLISILKSFNVNVNRPFINKNLKISDFVGNEGKINYNDARSFTLIPRPPMQPRDSFLVVGKKILATNKEVYCYNNVLKNINVIYPWESMDQHRLNVDQQFDAPLATVVGDTIILDCRDHGWLYQYFLEIFPDYKIVPVYIGGHNDAVYSVIKPGVLISTHHHNNYTHTFPDWEVKYIKNQSWNAIPGWRKLKHSNVNKWWVPEDINNQEFSDFIDTWLTHWLGYVKETVFDVNVLQLSSEAVLVNNYNKEMFDFLKHHSIEPIICPFRHRFFWDGGLHCITNDLYRSGEKENYV